MTLTLSIDEQLAEGARQVAESMGSTLEELLLRYLKDLTSQFSIEEDVAEIRRLSGQGSSQGWRFNRDEVHERENS